MLHNTITFCRTLLLAGAVGVLTAGAALAAPHGGGSHGGGFHSGGFHSGGFHSGGFHSGGFHSGGFHSGFHNDSHFRGFRGFAYPYYYGYGYGSSYSYPYYYGSDYSDPYASPDLSSDSAYSQGGGSALSSAAPDVTAHVSVNLPSDAELWFDETKTKSTGAVREFVTPELKPGRRYSYDLRARWHENGHEVTQTRKAVVTAGAKVRVDFTAPTDSAAPKPVPKAR